MLASLNLAPTSVGFRNYKYFCLFVFWAFFDCAFYTLCMMNNIFAGFSGTAGLGVSFAILFSGIMTVAFAIALLFFVLFHLKLVLSNATTIEFSEQRQATSPWDLGSSRKNFEAVFGENPYHWLLPIAPPPMLGDGYVYAPAGGFAPVSAHLHAQHAQLADAVMHTDEAQNLV